MTPGPKPKPTAVKRLTGNPGKRPLYDEPELPSDIPDCPDHLDDIGKAEWARVAPILVASKILKVTDRSVLAAYCDTYARWVVARRQVTKFGTVMKTKSGYVAQS